MELAVRTDNVKLNPATEDLIARRWDAIDRLADDLANAKLEIRRFEPRRGPDIIISQLTLTAGRHLVRAEERGSDLESAVSASLDKGLNQVRSYIGKRKSRRKQVSRDEIRQELAVESRAAGEAVEALDAQEPQGPSIVRTKHFEMKPMSVAEAIDQMELLAHDFYFFNNADAGTFSVIYRRRDGDLGILTPATS